MHIGIIIGRIGGLDGVALETEKWIDVLRLMGHKIFIISGQYEGRKFNPECETLVPEMSFFSPESYWGQKKAFFYPDSHGINDLLEHIDLYSKIIYEKILNWIDCRKIDLMISENASALPAHLEMGLGIKKAVNKIQIPIITHDHDFAWERGERYQSPHPEINKLVEETFPLQLPNAVHAVINSNARDELIQRYGIDSVIVPNVMDFDKPFGDITDHNRDLPCNLGICDDSVLLFQITRIVRRKGIETAIKLIDKLKNEKVKLIITGNYDDDQGGIYYSELLSLIYELKLTKQIFFASHIISYKGKSPSSDEKMYSLSDAYANATACTYFSTYEGFGNAFVEACLAKKPIFVNNYKPVFWSDIGNKGFKLVKLDNNEITDNALKSIEEIIYNNERGREIGEYNFNLARKYFSYQTLRERLEELISKALNS